MFPTVHFSLEDGRPKGPPYLEGKSGDYCGVLEQFAMTGFGLVLAGLLHGRFRLGEAEAEDVHYLVALFAQLYQLQIVVFGEGNYYLVAWFHGYLPFPEV